MEEKPEQPEGTSQANNKKRRVPGRETREYGQNQRGTGSEGAVGDETGVVDNRHMTGDFHSGSEYRILVWRILPLKILNKKVI